MAIVMPDLTVEVYNADYRVLSRIPWQEAVRLILRGAVYIIDVHTPAVHIRSPSLVIELPVSVARRGAATRRPHLRLLRWPRRHRGPHTPPLPWRRRHLVQLGGGVPVLQRPQGRPDAAGGQDDPDPRPLRAKGTRQVPGRAGPRARLISEPGRRRLNPRSVNR
jgi:hypothetical protein